MNENILIVEDEEALRMVVSDRLRREGFVVDSAPDGTLGFDKATSLPFDLIILDIMSVRRTSHCAAKSEATIYRAKAVDRTSPQPVPAAYRERPAQPAFQRASAVPLVRTSSDYLGSVAVMQQAVFVVVQDNPYSSGAPLVLRVSVWQVTVVPHTPHVVSQTTSKSI